MENTTESFLEFLNAVKTGKALVIISSAILLLTQLMKGPLFGSLMRKLPRSVRVLVPLGLGLVGTVFAKMGAGMNWVEAIVAGMGGGYLSVAHYEVVARPMAKMAAKK